MLGVVLRRIRDLVIVLALVGTAMFFILQMIPGSPAQTILGPYATPDQVAALETQMGLDRPVLEQYVTWFGRVLVGDLGYSFSQAGSVTTAVFTHLGPTLLLAVIATVLSIAIAVPLAVRTIARPNSWLSRTLLAGSSLGLAIPGFWLALILVLVFAVQLRILPVSGYISPLEDPLLSLWYLVLPVTVILCNQVALLVMTLRESLAAELLNPYIRTARAKGLVEEKVRYRHLLPNALLPAVTVVGSSFGTLLGGIVILETVFLIPGIGWLLNSAVQTRDYSLVLGVTLVSALIFVLINLAVDIVYGILDPRVRQR